MNIYDLVYSLLKQYPQLRSSDKKLIWTVWYKQGAVIDEMLVKDVFVRIASSPESITRAGRRVRRNYPELRGTMEVEEARKEKEKEKGTFVFREEVLT